ncbi:E3 ubiquitin/ISG15 ligase TRIM25-like [Lithobates pipiens]
MTSSHLKENLECSVCLNVYTDPVTLTCGHHFCRDCIGPVLDTQWGTGGYSCPECKENFKKRPVPQKNITLCKILETLQTTQGGQESYVLCDNRQNKSPEHVLCDPSTSPENRKCSVHKKILEYYCTEDETCICVSCRLDGEHRGHQVETLDEASEKKKKQLRNDLQELMTEREETEKRVQSLQEHGRKVQGKADDETERVTVLFRDLRRRLEDLEKRVLREISGQVEQVSLSLSDMIQQLEIKKEELSRKLRHIEELCNVTDPLTVLQESDTGDLCGDEDRERHDVKFLHDGGDLDVAGISYTLHTGLSDIMSGVIVQKYIGTHVHPHSPTTGKGHIHAEPSRRCPQPSSTVQPSRRCPQPSRRCPQLAPTIQPSIPPQPTLGIQPSIPPQPTLGIQPSIPPQPTLGIQPSIPPQPTLGIQPSIPPQPTLGIQPSIPPQPTLGIQPSIPPQPSPTVQPSHNQAGGPNIGSVPQTSGVSEMTDILLNVRTAGNNLHISGDRKTASWSYTSQNRPEAPERFRCSQVMSSQRFSSGRHYWEVDVGRALMWRAGMCYPSIERQGDQSLIGYNEKSWCLERWGCNRYSAIHDNNKTRLPGGVSSGRVRIDLDYEAGRISFYDLCDPIRHLHTFTTTFTEPLHAGVCVVDDCIKICGGDQKEKSQDEIYDWYNSQPIEWSI